MSPSELMRRTEARLLSLTIAEAAVTEAEAAFSASLASYRRADALAMARPCDDFLVFCGLAIVDLTAARYSASQAARRALQSAYERRERILARSVYSAHKGNR